MYRYSGSSIYKDTISSVRHSHKFFYSFTSKLSTNHNNIQQVSDIKTKFQIIIQAQQTIYSSLFLLPLSHNPAPLEKLPFPLKPPKLLIRLWLIWLKLTLPIYSNNYLPFFIKRLPIISIKNKKHCAYQRIPNFQKNKQIVFIKTNCKCNGYYWLWESIYFRSHYYYNKTI